MRFFLFLFLLLPACSQPSFKRSSTTGVLTVRENDDNLTRDFAQHRAEQIQRVAYQLKFQLQKKSKSYRVQNLLKVELSHLNSDLSVDLFGHQIDSVKVNGTQIFDFKMGKGALEIPRHHLALHTEVEIQSHREFDAQVRGFQSFVDPIDQAEYLYTDFEPDRAHTTFPCFDQPDLKAKFSLQVEAPSDWKVISNAMLKSKSKSNSGLSLFDFYETAPISTYLFFLGAGDYAEWKDREGSIPLMIYARKSLAKQVDAKTLFAITKKGLRFFADFFGTPYPFPKYAQLFVPDFGQGGMENPGAVTLNERNLPRGAVSPSFVLKREYLILHEMAHMWFGDLVTMKWWNDLWLNESFATYLGYMAIDRALKKPEAWADFFGSKAWAYHQDQLVTTHAIENDIPDVRTAKGSFDAITYSKGASSLMQLHFYVGEKGFRQGLQNYFRKYAFQNTTRENFIQEISSASGVNLEDWTKAWLQTSGPQRLQTKWTCERGQLQGLSLEQAPNRSGALAPRQLEIALFQIPKGGSWKKQAVLRAQLKGASEKVAFPADTPCPDFVLSNWGDQDYGIYEWNLRDFNRLSEALQGKIQDPLARLQLWQAAEQMLWDLKITPEEFFKMAMHALAQERDPFVLGRLLGRHSTLQGIYLGSFTPESRKLWAPQLEELVWKRAQEIEFFDFYLKSVQTPEGLSRLKAMLKGGGLPKGIQLDQDRRWVIILSLARSEAGADLLDLIKSEQEKDPSSKGQRTAFAALVARPDKAAKLEFWNQLKAKDPIPFAMLREGASEFQQANEEALSREFLQDYFNWLRELNWSELDSFVGIYLESLFPRYLCEPGTLKLSQQSLQSASRLTEYARQTWKESNDELEHCILIRQNQMSKSRGGMQ